MNVSIKKLSVNEAKIIADVISTSLKEQDFPYQEKTDLAYSRIYSKEYFTKFLEKKDHAVFGAYQNENLVGIIVMMENDGGVLHIDWLVIKKEFRGKGFGTLLLKEAGKWALEQHLHYVYLFTETDKNIAFYEKRGFHYIGKHSNSWFGETEHILGKLLRDKPFEDIWTKQ